MDWLTKSMMLLQGFGFAVALVVIVYLIFRRLRIRAEEKFEKRDNKISALNARFIQVQFSTFIEL